MKQEENDVLDSKSREELEEVYKKERRNINLRWDVVLLQSFNEESDLVTLKPRRLWCESSYIWDSLLMKYLFLKLIMSI